MSSVQGGQPLIKTSQKGNFHFQVVFFPQVLYLWFGESASLKNLNFSLPLTRLGLGTPATSTLLSNADDSLLDELGKQVSKRFKIPVFVASDGCAVDMTSWSLIQREFDELIKQNLSA